MGTVITWVISFFLVVSTAFVAITSVITNSTNQAQAVATSNQRLIDDIESSFKLVSLTEGVAQTRLDLVLTNDGRRTLDDFEDWVVTVRYDQSSGGETYLAPTYATVLADNTWTAHSFWLDHTGATPEAIEPSRLNVHEELEIRIQLSPLLEASTFVVVTLTSPIGTTESITLEV
ncbi:MAG: hypothetical protein HOF01_02725 [Chloroflexi bacterium]|jgi:hypothetical protein|nr:hypothetical protein [Chloroflexota bacterium]